MVRLCEGLSEEDARRSLVDSGTSILGLIKHLAYCERGWFQEAIAGHQVEYPFPDDDPEGDLRVEPDETSAEIIAFYEAECARSREILQQVEMDDLVKGPARFDYNVRWVVAHMIEETARHCGHADILREQIDGFTGVGYETDVD